MKKFVIYFIIGFVILFAWFRFIDFRKTLMNFKTIDTYPLIFGMIFLVLPLVLRSIRLKIILEPFKNISIFQIWKIFTAGLFMNYFFNVQIGVAAELILLKKLEKISVSQSLSAIMIGRIYDLTATFSILLLLPFFSFKLHNYLKNSIALVSLLFFLGILIFLVVIKNKEKMILIFSKFLFFIPKNFKVKLLDFAESFIDNLILVKNQRKDRRKILFISFLIRISEGSGLVFFAKSFLLNIPLAVAIFGQSISLLLFFLPAPPLQLGVNEWYTSLVYTYGFGFQKDIVSSLALFGHGVFTLMVLVLGVISFSLLGINLNKVFERGEQ